MSFILRTEEGESLLKYDKDLKVYTTLKDEEELLNTLTRADARLIDLDAKKEELRKFEEIHKNT